MTAEEKIRQDLARFQATGELPDAWVPEIDDSELEEINRELEAIESGCVEPPRFGWLSQYERWSRCVVSVDVTDIAYDPSPMCRCEECPIKGPFTCIGGEDD